jgi:hypothetical protein
VDITTREEPTWVEAADLDRDGFTDLIVSNTIFFEEYLTVFMGNEAGGFTLRGDIPIPGQGVASFLHEDFDHDGEIDLLVPCVFSDTVFLYRGDGNGGFREPEGIWAGTAPSPVTAGDFDGDDNLDFVASSWITGYVNVMMGRGDGRFHGPTPYFVQGGPNFHCVGDFNEDTRVDFAVANSTFNDVALLLGRGDGTFVNGETFNVLYDAYTPAVGDFNEDGHQDLACGTHHSLSILHGDGEGGFERVQDFPTVAHFKWVSAGDFTEDGHDDVAICIKDLSTVALLPGDGSGYFGSYLPLEVGTRPQSLLMTDLDRDGHVDFLAACGEDSVVSILGSTLDENVLARVREVSVAISGNYGILSAPLSVANRSGSPVWCDAWLTISSAGSAEELVPLTVLDWPANPLPIMLDPYERIDAPLFLMWPRDSFGGNARLRLRLGNYPESLSTIEYFEVAALSVAGGN